MLVSHADDVHDRQMKFQSFEKNESNVCWNIEIMQAIDACNMQL